MKVKCEGCGSWHTVSPTAMAIIIQSLQQGDLQRVTKTGIEPLCLGDAFNVHTLENWRNKLDSKTVVVFDRTHWTDGKHKPAPLKEAA